MLSKAMSNSNVEIITAAIYAQSHLDTDLSLSKLAHVANMSTHHFHRKFVQETGETPAKFVQRLRIEKATFRLYLHNDSVISIALDCGFSNPETLARAFKRQHGISPRAYRKNRLLAISAMRGNFRNQTTAIASTKFNNYNLSATKPIHMRNTDIAFIHSLGPYEDVDCRVWDELRDWSNQKQLPNQHIYMGIAHNIPNLTPPEKLRFDACVTVPAGTLGNKRVRIGQLRNQLYALTTHIGNYQSLPAAYPKIITQSNSLNGWEIAALPIIEIYRDNSVDTLRTISTTDIYIPLRPTSLNFKK